MLKSTEKTFRNEGIKKVKPASVAALPHYIMGVLLQNRAWQTIADIQKKIEEIYSQYFSYGTIRHHLSALHQFSPVYELRKTLTHAGKNHAWAYSISIK